MSQVLNLISKVHDAQLKVVAKGPGWPAEGRRPAQPASGQVRHLAEAVRYVGDACLGDRPADRVSAVRGSKRRRLGQAQRIVSEQAGVCPRCEDPLYSGEVPDGRAFLEP